MRRSSSGNLFGYAVLTFTLTRLKVHAEGGVACKDQHGHSYESGYHYIPGPEPCTFCVCDNGNPKWCKAFICKFLEENCKSFRRGNTCCEFICLDDTLSPMSNDKADEAGTNAIDGNANYDIGLRSVASFVTAIFSLSLLFFLIHRLRQRKIQGRENRQLGEDQRSLGNMGYLERGGLPHGVPMDDIPCGTGYSLWKPPGSNYFPRGEAPPPYEEAIAAARAEQALLSMNPHTLLSMNFSDNYMPNGNNHASVAVVADTQNDLTANTQASTINDSNIHTPLMSSSSRPLSSPSTYAGGYRPISQSSASSTVGLNTSTSTTSFTMETNTYENLPVASVAMTSFNHDSQHSAMTSTSTQPLLPISHSTIPKSYRQHTTMFPRQSGGGGGGGGGSGSGSGAFTISATLSNSDVSSHRTIPRTLTCVTGRAKDVLTDCSARDYLRLSPSSIAASQSLSRPMQLSAAAVTTSDTYKSTKDSDAFYTGSSTAPVASASGLGQLDTYTADTANVSERTREYTPSLSVANEINASGSFESVTCTCSMQALPTLHDDTDDYRSECENCKSATGSRYYLDNEDELVTSLHETMTLHRRPDEAASSATPQYYRTSLTLPTSTRQRTSVFMSRITGARENWFNTMPESSSGSSDEN
ncbi:PREDICTED: endochitinase A isoform X2 [Wasmannia auropunctata]|uniref:endochitinase A isoform X2 n=1 Tax=Wasmannia auropunctata TaxID=64793 RepID=UPI0005EF22F0|nr:PREDICTED: endochitinase A isoform X2 [Wasmannia auropunctata]